MKYIGPKLKLCRREWVNLFWPAKYDVKQKRKLPGQHGANMPRLSEFGKLLRNKQVLKRMYFLSEKQFSRIVNKISSSYAKNKGWDHDKALVQFLERRLDSVIVRSGLAKTIMQARQMVVHWHFTLNGKKHNIPSYFVNPNDVLAVREKVKKSSLYQDGQSVQNTPNRLKIDKSNLEVTVLDLPNVEEYKAPVDVLKVIEFYARA